MSGLTNRYVEKIGKKILGGIFLGVFPCDLHPKVGRRKTFCLIFNLSKHNEKGTHFVAIFASKDALFYFDPFGKKISNSYVKKFIDRIIRTRQLKQNKKCIQSKTSIFCGFYCLSFLLSQKIGVSIKNYLSIFDSDLNKNDEITIDFIQEYF
jgi:hypothetical protein